VLLVMERRFVQRTEAGPGAERGVAPPVVVPPRGALLDSVHDRPQLVDPVDLAVAGVDAEASKIQAIGLAQAKAVEAKGLAQAIGYEAQTNALGSQATAIVAVSQAVSEGHVKVVPDVLVTGGGGGSVDGLAGSLMRLLQGSNGKGNGAAKALTAAGGSSSPSASRRSLRSRRHHLRRRFHARCRSWRRSAFQGGSSPS